MPAKKKSRATATPPPTVPPVRARFFPTTPRVTSQIEEWARSNNVRVRAVIPVYTEDSQR